MTLIQCTVASTVLELDQALHLRWLVFAGELGLLAPPRPPCPQVEREADGFDTLPTTLHFIAYADGEPVGTARLLLPNSEVARANGFRVGLSLESKLDLAEVTGPGVVLAESTRLCIARPWRKSRALATLHAAMRRESAARGVTRWVASANAETSLLEDARIAYQVASDRGFVSGRWHLPARPAAALLDAPRPGCVFYTPDERRQAQRGDLRGLRLPPTLKLFASRMGARFVGEPIYDDRFRRYSIPLVTELSECK